MGRARVALTTALLLFVLGGLLERALGVERGLTRFVDVRHANGVAAEAIPPRVTPFIGNASFDKERRDAGLPPGDLFRWAGLWDIPSAAVYTITTSGADHVAVALDGRVVSRPPSSAEMSTPVALTAGPHWVDVTYARGGATEILQLTWASAGSAPRPFGQAALYPNVRALRRSRVVAYVWWADAAAWIWAAVVLVRDAARRRRSAGLAPGHGRRHVALRRALLAGILVYAALLRFDALIGRWGPIESSAGITALQERADRVIARLRPAAMAWTRSPFPPGGDPYSYLQQARERTSFYEAHLREPLFPFSVKAVSRLLGQSERAGVVTSALFSWLVVLATYLLGATAFSPGVGVGAAALLAIERDMVGFGVSGYRDDAFALFVVALGWCTLWLQRRPGYGRAAAWGLLAAAACLTRLTALSFVLAALGYMLAGGFGPRRFRLAGVALTVTTLLTAPFLIASWRTFGTPFHAVTGLRSSWEWEATSAPAAAGWSHYLFGRFGGPFGLLDTVSLGLVDTFTNKWLGYWPWSSHAVGAGLALLAGIGLLAFCWSANGRFLLVFLAASLGPFLLVWGLPTGDQYRYSMHAYPVLALAVGVTTDGLARAIRDVARAGRAVRWVTIRPLVVRATGTIAVVVAAWLLFELLPYFRMREELQHTGRTQVVSGARDHVFFPRGWYAPVTVGNVTTRFSRARHAVVWVPMRGGYETELTLRLDPFAAGASAHQTVEVGVNGERLASFNLGWDPQRVGSYRVRVPGRLLHDGLNRLDLEAAYLSTGPIAGRNAVDGATPGAPTLIRLRRAPDIDAVAPLPPTPAPASFEAAVAAGQRVGIRLWYVAVATVRESAAAENAPRSVP
jgi:hypothetical protein